MAKDLIIQRIALLDAVDDLPLLCLFGSREGGDGLVVLLVEVLSRRLDGAYPLSLEVVEELCVDEVHTLFQSL